MASRFRRKSLGPDFGYIPGEQPPDDGNWLKLNTNESPLPPSPRVAAAIAADESTLLRRYPNPFGEPLRSALARHHGVEREQVLVANGADEVIDCVIRAFCDPGDTIVYPWPTYSLFPVLADVFNAKTAEVPLNSDLTFPKDVAAAPGSLRFLVNPNAPTGLWMPPDELERLVEGAPGVIAIDEAYNDFAPASCVPLVANHENWLVIRTFSKSYSLAGLRVGYAIGSHELISDLYAVKDSYPISRWSVVGALAALEDTEHHRTIVETVRTQRERLSNALRDAKWTVTPSQANFVFVRPPDGDAQGTFDRLREQQILIRHWPKSNHPDYVRITIGSEPEMTRLLKALGLP